MSCGPRCGPPLSLGKLVPILAGSSLKNKGVQLMLDAIVDYLPSPLDVPPVTGIDPNTDEEVVRTVEPGQPFSALAFKIAADPHVGKLAFVRVYSGTLDSGSYVLNTTKNERERVGRLLQNARQSPRRYHLGQRWGYRRGDRTEVDLHGRHAFRPQRTGDARVDHVPGAGHLGLDRAEDAGRPGQDGRRAGPSRRGGSDVPAADQRRNRTDGNRRDGRAPS